jgi:plasmid stability protein
MPKMIQIRHVPDALHRQLKQRAAGAGMTLSDYLRRELEQLAAQPTWDEVMERLGALEPIRSDESAADAVRAERDGR